MIFPDKACSGIASVLYLINLHSPHRYIILMDAAIGLIRIYHTRIHMSWLKLSSWKWSLALCRGYSTQGYLIYKAICTDPTRPFPQLLSKVWGSSLPYNISNCGPLNPPLYTMAQILVCNIYIYNDPDIMYYIILFYIILESYSINVQCDVRTRITVY